MPIARETAIWMDGQLVEWEDARVHVLTHALNHGTAAYEGIRSHPTSRGPRLFRLADHVERLHRSAASILITVPYDTAELMEAARSVVAVNRLPASYMRILAYRGYGEMEISGDLSPVSVMIATWKQGPSFSSVTREAGLRTTVSAWRRPDPRPMPVGKVAGVYVTQSLARKDAVQRGFDEAIMLGANGAVAEATIENLFVVRDGELLTPPLSDGPLAGITRRTVMTLASDAGIPVREQSLHVNDFADADEVFLTGTGAGIVPVQAIDEHRFDRPWDVYRAMAEAYEHVTHGRDSRYLSWVDQVEDDRVPVTAD